LLALLRLSRRFDDILRELALDAERGAVAAGAPRGSREARARLCPARGRSLEGADFEQRLVVAGRHVMRRVFVRPELLALRSTRPIP